MEQRTWVIGDYCQLSPGQAPPEDWGAIMRIRENEGYVLRWKDGVPATIQIPLDNLHPVESDDFKAAIKARFRETVNGQPSLHEIWSRYPP